MSEAMPVFLIVIGKIPVEPGVPNQHRPSGKPSCLAFDSVSLLGSPPLQSPTCAFAGDTVTDRIVGTVVRERLMLAAVPAPGGADLLPQAASPVTIRTTATGSNHLTLRAVIAAPTSELSSARGHPVDLDSQAELARGDCSDSDQQYDANSWPQPRGHGEP